MNEIKFFQSAEAQGYNASTEEQEKKSKEDAELIETLAADLETLEQDLNKARSTNDSIVKELNESQLRVRELEMKVEAKSSPNASKREAIVTKQMEELQKELTKAKSDAIQFKKDAAEGIPLMRELDKNLRAARAERDAALLSAAQQQDASEKSALIKELEVALQAMKNERDEAKTSNLRALSEISNLNKSNQDLQSKLSTNALFHENEDLKEDVTQCKNLNKELQTVLEGVQRELEETQQREEQLKQDWPDLESALDELSQELQDLHTTNVAEIKQDHELKLEGMQARNEVDITSLKSKHAKELEIKNGLLKSQEDNMNQLRKELSDTQIKMRAFEVATSTSNLSSSFDCPMDEVQDVKNTVLSSLQLENSILKEEKADLLNKLEAGPSYHGQLAQAVQKIKKLEKMKGDKNEQVQTLQNKVKDIETKVSTLKEELSVQSAKAEKMQSLQKVVEEYAEEIKELEKKCRSLDDTLKAELTMQSVKATHTAKVENELMNVQKINEDLIHEVSLLKAEKEKSISGLVDERDKHESLQLDYADAQLQAKLLRKTVEEAEITITTLKSDLELQLSKSAKLESTLSSSRQANEGLTRKVTSLEEVAQEMQLALHTVSSEKEKKDTLKKDYEEAVKKIQTLESREASVELEKQSVQDALNNTASTISTSQSSSPVASPEDKRRKIIEQEALNEYYSQHGKRGNNIHGSRRMLV